MKNLPVNSTDPLFLAAEIFRDTLLEVGVEYEAAEKARKIFLSVDPDTSSKEIIEKSIQRIKS